MTKTEKTDVTTDSDVETGGVEQTTETAPEEKKSELTVRFTVQVTNKKIEKEIEETTARYAGEIKMPGFRKGKVPIEVVKSRFKEAIEDEVINKLVEKAVFNRIEKDKLKIASQPQVEKLDYKEGKTLKADIEVEVFPTVDLPELADIEVEIPSAELAYDSFDEAKQVDAVLEGNRRRTPVVAREIKDGDYVMIEYQSKILKTKKMTPRKSSHYIVNETEEFEILDLYKDMTGKKIDDNFTITRTYPSDYKKKIWAGKDIEHYITVNSVFEMVKPQLDDAFLKSIGFDDETSFKARLKEEYEAYNDNRIEEVKLKYITEKLIDTINFEVPKGMVEQEAMRALSQYQEQLNLTDKSQAKVLLESMKGEAEKSVRWSFIFDAVKTKHNIDVGGDDLENEYKVIAEKNNAPLKEVRKAYMNKENAKHLKEGILKKKVMDLLKETVKVKEIESDEPEAGSEKNK